jgi:hypothetical protein
MNTNDINVTLLLAIYSAVTHWEYMWASFDLLMEEYHEV